MKTYVGTIRSKEKKKSYIIGDSHLNRIRKDKFKDSTPKARVYVKSFSGANTNQLDYYVVPLLVDEKPDNVVIHIGYFYNLDPDPGPGPRTRTLKTCTLKNLDPEKPGP